MPAGGVFIGSLSVGTFPNITTPHPCTYRFFSRGSTTKVTEKRARVKILIPLLRIEAGSNYLLLLKRYFSCHSYSDSLLLKCSGEREREIKQILTI